jgi:hypothetical protein
MTNYEFEDRYDTWTKDDLINRLMKLDVFFFDVRITIPQQLYIETTDDEYSKGYNAAVKKCNSLIEYYTEQFRTGKVIAERRIRYE